MTMFALGYLAGLATIAVAAFTGLALQALSDMLKDDAPFPEPAWKQIGRLKPTPLRGRVKPDGGER